MINDVPHKSMGVVARYYSLLSIGKKGPWWFTYSISWDIQDRRWNADKPINIFQYSVVTQDKSM